MITVTNESMKVVERAMNFRDRADTERLAEAVRRLLPALEEFDRFAGPDPAGRARDKWLGALDKPLPERGIGWEGVVDELAHTVVPYGLRNGAPGFSGWVTTEPTTSGIVAALAATVAGSQRWWVQPFNYLETVALRWLAQLLGIPADLQGTFTSGGSVANLVGIGAARQRAYEQIGCDPARDGLPAGVRSRIYASAELHHVVLRSAGVLGLGRSSVTLIKTDDKQRIDLRTLEHVLEEDRRKGIIPLALVASAGTVNTGAIDPIGEMVGIVKNRNIWLHVDGAYGLFGRLDSRVTSLYNGLEHADSVVVDPHKWLAAPVGIGAVFVRDRALLGRAFTLEPADYLEGSSVRDREILSPFDEFGELYHDFSVEQSAPSRGAQVWAILREIGAEGIRERVTRHNDFARRLASLVEADERLELLAEPVLSICCFRYRVAQRTEQELEELNQEIARRLRAESKYVPSTTRVNGKLALRPCYINPRTTGTEVDGLAARVRQLGDELAQ